jgi:Protein of unknown function (DUF1580)
MFDPEAEAPLPLSEAAKLTMLPKRRGKSPHATTLLRWCLYGIRGIKLESIVCGGTRCTSEQSIKRFFERLSTPFGDSKTITTSERKKSIARAQEELKAMGI